MPVSLWSKRKGYWGKFMHLIHLVVRSWLLSSFLFYYKFGDTKLQMAFPDFYFLWGVLSIRWMLACVTAASPRKKIGELFWPFQSLPEVLKIERTRSIARENFLVLSAIFNRANYCQKENKVPHLIYAKLFLNTIINGNTQTSFLRFFRVEAAMKQATSILNFWKFQMTNAKTSFRNFGKRGQLRDIYPNFPNFLTAIFCVPFHFPSGISSWNYQNFIYQWNI